MNVWKKLLLGAALAGGLIGAAHASGGAAWDRANVDTTNFDSLRNGAKVFVNYCLGCHSAAFMRFNRLRDIGLTEQQIKDNLLFTTDKVGDTMVSAIDPVQAKAWFGVNPPDLSVIARSRAGAGGSGADYIYTLLRTYYRDPSRPTGWNNTTFAAIGMPHPLWELQGERAPVFEMHEIDGKQEPVFTGEWTTVTPGTMTEEQYDQTVRDLVNYLQWMGEPAQNTRVRIGIWVMLFLLLFTFTAWRLNKAYWKDVT
ncbi:MAG: cytochrome c1 [Burkholderiaceae bacterium]|jgi:ubiquinol-cytochrome c reductase cytochrome c1 subunit|nr:cytochrome c1 [Burkholderiaceae bacterium]